MNLRSSDWGEILGSPGSVLLREQRGFKRRYGFERRMVPEGWHCTFVGNLATGIGIVNTRSDTSGSPSNLHKSLQVASTRLQLIFTGFNVIIERCL